MQIKPLESTLSLHLERVGKSYGQIEALQDISFEVDFGTTVALLGPNGAGKSTLFKLMMGSARATQGNISVLGHKPGSLAARQTCGAMLQVSGVPATLSVLEHIKLFRNYYPHPLPIEEIIGKARLEGLENRRYGTLSGGEQQKLHFALAIAGDPKLLFLDEPTTSMDVETRQSMWKQVKEFAEVGKTLIVSTHSLDEADSLADRIIILNEGRIVADASSREIRASVGATLVSACSNLNFGELSALPGVVRVERLLERTRLFVNAPEAAVRAWLSADPSLEGLEVQPAQLYDAYLHLVSDSEES